MDEDKPLVYVVLFALIIVLWTVAMTGFTHVHVHDANGNPVYIDRATILRMP